MDIKTYLGRYKTASLAMDAHTDAFEELVKKIEYYRGKSSSFKSYVQRLEDDLTWLADKVHADIVAMDEIRTEIKAALESIPDEQGRLILFYRFCLGKTETETAQLLGYKNRSYITKAMPGLIAELEKTMQGR